MANPFWSPAMRTTIDVGAHSAETKRVCHLSRRPQWLCRFDRNSRAKSALWIRPVDHFRLDCSPEQSRWISFLVADGGICFFAGGKLKKIDPQVARCIICNAPDDAVAPEQQGDIVFTQLSFSHLSASPLPAPITRLTDRKILPK